MKSFEVSQLVKQFLYKNIGSTNITNGIVTVMDDYTLAFKIREMSFMLDCETMTVMRIVGQIEGKTAVTYSHTDNICAILERGIKEYIYMFIEKLEKLEKHNQY